MVESTDPNALPQSIYDWLQQQGSIPPPAPTYEDARNASGPGGFQPVDRPMSVPLITVDPKTGRFTLSPPTFTTSWMHAANPVRAGINAFLDATGMGPAAASASTSMAAPPAPGQPPMPWQGNTAPEPWYSSWAGIKQAGQQFLGPGVPAPAGSTGPMPRVPPPVPGAATPTMPGPGTSAAVAAPPGAPPVAPAVTPASPNATPAQIFAAAAQGPGAGLSAPAAMRGDGGTAPVAPVKQPDKATAGMWDNLMNDPNFEFGLRLMEASQPTPGTHRGPSIFAALAGAGLGELQSKRAAIAASRSYELEAAKVQAQNTANILTAQSNAQFKELEGRIQSGQLDLSKGQLRAEIEKNRAEEKKANPFRIQGAGNIDDDAAKAFDEGIDSRYDAQLKSLGVNTGKDTDPVGGGQATGAPQGSPVATRVVNGKTYVQYSDGSIYPKQ